MGGIIQGVDAVPLNGQSGYKVTWRRRHRSPFVRLIDDVADLHVEGPVLGLKASICGPFWKKRARKQSMSMHRSFKFIEIPLFL